MVDSQLELAPAVAHWRQLNSISKGYHWWLLGAGLSHDDLTLMVSRSRDKPVSSLEYNIS